jgi:hypothetical protein
VTDDQQWQVASEIEQSHPHWVVMWGCYSRLFWAFPHFQVPKGTIVSAPDRERLLADMHSVEAEMSANSRVPIYSSPMPAARLPRRPSRGQLQRGILAEGPPPAGASRPESMDSPLLVPSPRAPGRSVPGAAPPGMLWTPQAELGPARSNYDPYVSDPYVSDPYVSDPYVSDPYVSDPYDSDPYDSDPYDPDVSGQD